MIVNLRNRTAEVFTEPDRLEGRYRVGTVLKAADELSLHVGDEFFTLGLAQILP